MTKEKKRKLIMQLCNLLQKECLSNLDQIPDEWDGKEIRWYVGDKSKDLLTENMEYKHFNDKKRYNDYRNLVLIKNL